MHVNAIRKNGRTPEDNIWRQSVTDELIIAGMYKEAESFAACQADDTIFSVFVCSDDIDHDAKTIAHTCHLRICPECAHRESARVMNRYVDKAHALARLRRDNHSLKHIILTTRFDIMQPDIKSRLRSAFDSVGATFDVLLGKGWQRENIGYIAGAEFGEKGKKLHFHVLFYGPWLDQSELQDIWCDLTGNTAIPYIKAITRGKNVEKACAEILKYTTKLSAIEPVLMPRLLDVLKGTRRIRSKGVFYRLEAAKRESRLCDDCNAKMTIMPVDAYNAHKSQKMIESLAAIALLPLRNGNNFLPESVVIEEKPTSDITSQPEFEFPPPVPIESLVPPPKFIPV